MIGIFDSGVGGLTVARAIAQLMPDLPLLYFGDTARTPYGTKSAEVITDYSLRNSEFLLEKGAKMLIIGCNSASSVATQKLREQFSVPVLEVIGPAAQKAVEVSSNGRIGVIGTRATVRSTIYERTISALSPDCKVFSRPCPLLVPLVEEGWLEKRETKMIIRKYLHPFKHDKIDTLILGCTHYPILKDLIQSRVGRKVKIIDSSIEVASTLKKILSEEDLIEQMSTKKEHRFYFSDITESASTMTSMLFGRPVELLLP